MGIRDWGRLIFEFGIIVLKWKRSFEVFVFFFIGGEEWWVVIRIGDERGGGGE